MKAMALMASGLLLAGCAGVDEGAETRPVGDPVLGADELREAKVAVDFTKHVKPILEARCLYCHDGREMPGKWDLSSKATAMASGASGPRIVPGNAAASLMISFIKEGNHIMSMPAVGVRVSPKEVEVLEWWINAGATWPEGKAGRLKASE